MTPYDMPTMRPATTEVSMVALQVVKEGGQRNEIVRTEYRGDCRVPNQALFHPFAALGARLCENHQGLRVANRAASPPFVCF